jgi:hypothetical protein
MKLELCANRDIEIEPYPANPLGDSDVRYVRTQTPEHDDYDAAAEATYWNALAAGLAFANMSMEKMLQVPVIEPPEPLFATPTQPQTVELSAAPDITPVATAAVSRTVELEYAA